MFAQKKYEYVKNTRVPNNINKTSYSAFTVNAQGVYSGADKCKNLSHMDTSIKIGRIIL